MYRSWSYCNAPLTITHGAGIAQLRYGDDGISIAYDQPGVPALAA